VSENGRAGALTAELRRQGIQDARVLRAIAQVPRDLFVSGAFQAQAYENAALPIECGQTISQPYVVAVMTEALEVGARMKVLEIGTGSGYQAAVLAQLCRRVYTIERYRTLLREAEARFQRLGLHNVTARLGDGTKGWPEQAPFERILVTAAAAEIPERLAAQLAPGGIMIVPVNETADTQQILRVRRGAEGLEAHPILPVRFVPLVEGVARER
jgi:protein-L-isoaspartate(D-aspartate) O-methyltransferase